MRKCEHLVELEQCCKMKRLSTRKKKSRLRYSRERALQNWATIGKDSKYAFSQVGLQRSAADSAEVGRISRGRRPRRRSTSSAAAEAECPEENGYRNMTDETVKRDPLFLSWKMVGGGLPLLFSWNMARGLPGSGGVTRRPSRTARPPTEKMG